MTNPLWVGVREGCGSCAFGKEHRTPVSVGPKCGTDLISVLCRRFPPTIIQVEQTNNSGRPNWSETEQRRPWMVEDDWCGEWKRKV